MNLIEEIDKILRNNPSDNLLSEALRRVQHEIATGGENEAELFFIQGKLLWRMGERNRAASAYARAAALNPDSPAVQALEHARTIESFFNPDLLNP